MKRTQNVILPLVAVFGLLAGGLYSQFSHNKDKEPLPPGLVPYTIPEGGIVTDVFSLKLFQQVLQEQKENVLAAPRALSELLYAFTPLAGGHTREELNSLKLYDKPESYQSAAIHDYLIAVDINVPRKDEAGRVVSIPFSENTPLALSIFNGALAQSSPSSNAQFATSTMVTPRTRLLAGAVAYGKCTWEIPFLKADTRMAEFDSRSGAMPNHPQMRSRGAYRMAKAEDGAWKAVLLPIKDTNQALIGILPAGDAREFAAALTPEQLSNIRQALVTAQPEDTLVEFPRLELEVRPYDMRYTLRKLGLNSAFDTERADFSGISDHHLHLGALIHASGIWIIESQAKAQPTRELELARNTISFSRPFIWFIAGLTADTPFEFIGLVEEM